MNRHRKHRKTGLWKKNCELQIGMRSMHFGVQAKNANLIQFIKDRKSNLLTNYDSFQLLRNEEVYKIFDFDTGRGFQPDFLLFLHGKVGNPNAYYQVFIEPKGRHLAGDDSDGWKQDFLEEIAKRYGKNHAIIERNSSYVLIGLPFFNTEDIEMERRFNKSFDQLVLSYGNQV